jgi:hypothetical protein
MPRGKGKHSPHPSRSQYVRGCRCEGCVAKNTLYFVAYRNRGSTSVYSEAGAAMLRTPCWCESKRKLIPASEVAAGRTWSCGEGCAPGD